VAWDEIYEGRDVFSVVHQDRMARAKSWIDALCLREGAGVLEIGCGAGHLTGWLATERYRVTATDTSEQMLASTARTLRETRVAGDVSICLADTHRLPFIGGTFDAVIALGVIPWLHDPSVAMMEMTRVTKAGGYVLFNADNVARLSIAFDPLRSPHLAPLRARTKVWLSARRGQSKAGDHDAEADVEAGMHSHSAVNAMTDSAGLEVLEGVDIGFGPFTFLRRELLPQRVGVTVHRLLQRASDRRVPIVACRGSQYLLLGRKR
jgi:ubiquinone/menaquinone biosynthesis C-methylase UbiE